MILIGGVGYSNLRDMSFGRYLSERLGQMSWPDNVQVEDLSYGPVMVYQWLEASTIRFDQAIIVSAAKRGRPPGTLVVYQWPGILPDPAEIQLRISEAVMGVIDLDNLLIVCKYFGVLPDNVLIVEVEPQDENWGLGFSPLVAARVNEVIDIIKDVAIRNY
jgi:hydrogenase maturation protease